MTIAFLIYIVSILPDLKSSLGVLCFLAVIGAIITVMMIMLDFGVSRDHYNGGQIVISPMRKKLPMLLKWFIPLAFIFGLLCVLIPKEKTAWLMLGGYAAQTVYESEDGTRYRKLIMKKIDEALGEKTKEMIEPTKGEK